MSDISTYQIVKAGEFYSITEYVIETVEQKTTKDNVLVLESVSLDELLNYFSDYDTSPLTKRISSDSFSTKENVNFSVLINLSDKDKIIMIDLVQA